jgi:hypothetical protein
VLHPTAISLGFIAAGGGVDPSGLHAGKNGKKNPWDGSCEVLFYNEGVDYTQWSENRRKQAQKMQ